MFELTLVNLTASSSVDILAWEQAEIVREIAIRASVAIVGQCELAKLVFLRIVDLHLPFDELLLLR